MKRADGTALSVIVVLFDHHKSLRNHGDTRTLEHYPLLSGRGDAAKEQQLVKGSTWVSREDRT